MHISVIKLIEEEILRQSDLPDISITASESK